MTKEEIKQKIEQLQSKLTGDMFADMDLREEIHNLEMQLNEVQKPDGSPFECFGCGS
jgi:hypothetical protein